MDRGAWRATVHGGHKESDTTEQLTHTHTHTHTTVSINLDTSQKCKIKREKKSMLQSWTPFTRNSI